MSRAAWITPLYGYVVCVVAVITVLVSVSGFVDASPDTPSTAELRQQYETLRRQLETGS